MMGWQDDPVVDDYNLDEVLARLAEDRKKEELARQTEITGRSADPSQQIRSSRLARRFFDVDTAKELQRGDIHNANNLLGIDSSNGLSFDGNWGPRGHIEQDQMEGPWEFYQMRDAGDVDRGLFFMGDKLNHAPMKERESAPLNSSLLDPLYSASDTIRDTVKRHAPGVVNAIDSADDWLFNATGGFLGTPKNITPENQLELRKAFREQKQKDDAYRFQRR